MRQLGLAIRMYSDENSDRFPNCTGAVWPWDLPASAANAFVKNGGTRNILYCPSFWKQNDDELWRFTTGQLGEIATDNASGYRVIGYAVAFQGAGRVRVTNITESFNPRSWRINGEDVNPGASERVIAADGTLSQLDNERDRSRNNYTQIFGGWSKSHSSPHLSGKIPAGGNLLFLDGHGEWHKFDKMFVRTDGAPSFWW